MSYAGRDFDTMDVGENEVFTLDFANDMLPADQITVATTTLTVRTGIDPNPSAHLVLVPIIFGTQVAQRISGLLAEVDYRLTAIATTAQGNTLTLYSHIRCRAQP